jgi:methylated-DNA-[protein]-cysteine S-methyltransferase
MASPSLNADAFDARLRAPFATLGIRTDERHVTHISFLPLDVAALAPKRDTLAYLACVQLSAYLDDPRYVFDLPIKLAGSMHQIKVWEAMRRIPSGKTCTYGELAATIGSNARAVGGACGSNPVPIVVPCHRVVAANGLGGFMGGSGDETLGIKRWLLAHEQRPFELR